MPNTRRRRFSAQNEQPRPRRTTTSGKPKSSLSSHPDEHVHRNKTRPNSSKESRASDLLAESTAPLRAANKRASTEKIDKDVAATSSNIDFCHYLTFPEKHATESTTEEGAVSGAEPSAEGAPSEEMCRICHGGSGTLVSACRCRGSVGRVHVRCLERWLTEAGRSRCELCGVRYHTERVHRYGLTRALFLWLFTHSAKQLLVDGVGVALMSPLALVAGWLSGRTLSALTAAEPHAAPWPLASTFVLACVTLVCYYCWVVSAATRHALSWWVWYRAHYQVRLTDHQQHDTINTI